MRIALVGAEFEENLAVRYLRAALERVGHDVVQLVFNGPDETEEVARALATSGAELAGLSMVFTYRAREFAALAERARELGFAGHIVAGGHFAAFHAPELLRDVQAIDSAAIGEGEEILCELAAGLGDLGSVRGLLWRDGREICRNAPAEKPPDLDCLAIPPRKRPLDEYLGLGITNILSSRGCSYSCTFCSIVAWHRLCGGERVRMRSIESVADEMAGLWREGARIFNFHDDNFFLPERPAMLLRIRSLGEALARRGVGRIAFAIKARPDAVDEEVFGALKELGLFRVFLGIEAGSATSLRQLGRRQTVEQNVRALAVVNALDIHTAFNLLMLNPDSTLEDLADNVRFLREHPHNPMNFCRTEIYSGTPLEKKLRHEDRLLGDYWGHDYVIADPRAEQAFQIMRTAFRTRSYGHPALHHVAMAVDYEHQLLCAFFDRSDDLRREVKRFIVRVNENTALHLESVVDACARGFASDDVRETFTARLSARVEADNERLGAAGEDLLEAIRARASRRPGTSFSRTARAVGLAASVALAATGCKKSGDDSHPTEMVAPPPSLSYPNEEAPLPLEPSADAGGASSLDAGGDAADGASQTAADASADAAADAAPPKPKPSTKPRRPRPPTHPTEMVPISVAPSLTKLIKK